MLLGLVLMNSAGRILGSDDEEYDDKGISPDSDLLPEYQGPSPEFLRVFGSVVFKLLQPNIARLCEWLYPSNPQVVKDGLAASIYRDSCDLGASDVIAAGGNFLILSITHLSA